MTRIKRLEMKGFKSFANKTELVFGEGFNCVLGPNGSGKSNVLDAICFVLGKASAKGLRAEKSANLIYNGGKKKSPAKQGEVSIVFDNSKGLFGEGEELIITRIVMHSGQSKYKINGKNSSRQEILDLLSRDKINPDGYNIILQGDINHLIEMSTVERRGIIEEIAGISIYEEKKEKALRELGRVEERLNEADIVLAERKMYLRELKKERDQALKFKDLDEKIKRNKTTILHIKEHRKTKELNEIQTKVEKHEGAIKKFGEKIARLQSEIAERKQGIEALNKEVEERGEKEQVALHKEVEALKVEEAVKEQRLETLEAELVKLEQRRDELESTNKELFDKIKLIEKERADIEKRIKTREENIEKLEKRITEFRQKHNVEDASKLDEEVETIDKEAEQIQDSLSTLREEQQELLREKDKVEIKLEQIDEKIARVAGLAAEHKAELEKLKERKAEFKNATKELNTAVTEDSSLAAQLQTARAKLLSRKEELAKLEGQRASIAERIAGGTAITKILELAKKGTLKGVHGTVSELGHVKKEYALALEVAAGGRINSLVVDDDKVAATCIKYLREHQLGVATFLPLNKLRTPNKANVSKGPAVVGLAAELVEYQKQYEAVFRYVFGNTIIVKNIDAARKLGIGKARMATLEGDLVETSGAMQGGYRSKKRRGMGFQEKETSEQITKLEREVNDLEGVVARLEDKRRANEEAIERLRALKAELEGEIIKTEKSLHLDSDDAGVDKDEKKRLQGELAKLEERLDKVLDELSEQTTRLGTLKSKKQQLRDKVNALRSPALMAELNTFEEKKEELRREIGELQGELRMSDSEVKNILGPETEKVKEILKQQEKEKTGFTKERDNLTKELSTLKKSLAEKEKAEQKFFSQFKELFTKRAKLGDEVSERESKMKEHDLKSRESEQKKVSLGMVVARLKAELAGLAEEQKQFAGVKPYGKSEKSEEDILLEVREFERLREKIGHVNMKALDIYDQVGSEYEALVKKKGDLAGEREDVLVMINEVDAKKKDLFMKTFDVVNKNFQHFFDKLSRKGEAYLFLEDEHDPFAAGMTIKVKLTGKRFLDIRSLSGGEKTMTALAFLFAVQEHEPASFYIMDEVDAALDKHNSEKLAGLIRQYCQKAQYVIISHNDGVIGEADNLFGVSMNEYGISKVTTLKI